MAKKDKKLKVTFIRSTIGFNRKHNAVLESLGLHKLGDTNILPDNDAVRGMIFKVQHFVKVEENV